MVVIFDGFFVMFFKKSELFVSKQIFFILMQILTIRKGISVKCIACLFVCLFVCFIYLLIQAWVLVAIKLISALPSKFSSGKCHIGLGHQYSKKPCFSLKNTIKCF